MMRIRTRSQGALRISVVALTLLSGCTDDADMAPGVGNPGAGRERTGTEITRTAGPDSVKGAGSTPGATGASGGTGATAPTSPDTGASGAGAAAHPGAAGSGTGTPGNAPR